jgi:hypothetical protein
MTPGGAGFLSEGHGARVLADMLDGMNGAGFVGGPHFEAKHEAEEYLKKSGLSCTILRPVYPPPGENAPEAGGFLQRECILLKEAVNQTT